MPFCHAIEEGIELSSQIGRSILVSYPLHFYLSIVTSSNFFIRTGGSSEILPLKCAFVLPAISFYPLPLIPILPKNLLIENFPSYGFSTGIILVPLGV